MDKERTVEIPHKLLYQLIERAEHGSEFTIDKELWETAWQVAQDTYKVTIVGTIKRTHHPFEPADMNGQHSKITDLQKQFEAVDATPYCFAPSHVSVELVEDPGK